jgi:hypothetical protein
LSVTDTLESTVDRVGVFDIILLNEPLSLYYFNTVTRVTVLFIRNAGPGFRPKSRLKADDVYCTVTACCSVIVLTCKLMVPRT